ncbi:hypothetical protein FHS96_005546 [Sphingomonas zeicaulis]|uniref:ABC-three component system middle component 6 n=1 Tax=Sphingomonas zeicaulis TaxID=1632740 RepID=UPI003D232C58
MILPTKNIAPDRALLTLSGRIFDALAMPRTVSGVWDEVRSQSRDRPIAYSWFILAIDLLYLLGLVGIDQDGLLTRRSVA